MKNSAFRTFLATLLCCVVSSLVLAADYQLKLIKKFYSIGTASINGTYYPTGNSIARILSSNTKGLVAIAEPTAGSLANIEYLRRGQIDLALSQSDVAWQAYEGNSDTKFRELRVITSLYSEVIQLIVHDSSEIKDLSDLKGKRIAVGEKDSGSAASIMLVLKAAGLSETDYTIVYERFTRATESLLDGYVDAVYYAGAVPADGISRLAAKTPIRLVGIPTDVRAKLLAERPYFTSESIFTNSYKNQKNDINTIGFRALFVTTERLSANEVFNMLQAIYDNPNAGASEGIPDLKLHLSEALKGVKLEMLHEGARRFFAMHGLISPTIK
ncbi:MAG: TAXI family TRAP transporter solute-binding subunit [Candidatus Riflebacteria bacterium]|nr:TAXI family TRAP transporter solute-binding subunit [Candidatus Riflebacteria bacterium]